ncbi:MAG: hypothetical protein KF817_01770 [Phycisphaeraceae bacterium]|nr:hypothetical protein [Phycisphaeraceae bacterium]
MPRSPRSPDTLAEASALQFRRLVESVGVKRFAPIIGLSVRQVNRILSGAQPNPLERLIRALQAATPEAGDGTLDFLCEEMGGYFVREEALDPARLNAVRECAEAIAAISDGHVSDLDVREVREAISALAGLLQAVSRDRGEPRAWGGP